ncbi:glutathione S-transferase family protein [Alphaproteobacteria bacterium HT1-32]|nr:glutathione S-transferase family protein [Alphaproteobacteria bacterium HT1-32]|tara:strand:- start:102760 stop:103479 length:720 start_codon:yes stop_codon:yes gene_type:complete
MIDLYFWPTPNAYKASIMLEEVGLPYTVKPVHIGKGVQFTPEYEAINPNGKVPSIVDHDGPGGEPFSVFESGAILLYLSEKAGGAFMPSDARGRSVVLQWLMFQMGGVGPMLGQAHHFRKYAPEQIDYAVERYTREATRLYKVIDKRLGDAPFLAGDYSIADMAVYPWLRPYKWQGQSLDDYPNLLRWYQAVRERPAVQRGLQVMKEKVTPDRKKPMGGSWDVLFGGAKTADGSSPDKN